MLVAEGQQLHALDELATVNAPGPRARGRAQGATIGDHRRGQDLVAAGPDARNPEASILARLSDIERRLADLTEAQREIEAGRAQGSRIKPVYP